MRRSSVLTVAVLLAASPLPAWADVSIGVAGPMTGPLAAFGDQMRLGAELAVEDLNAAGGVLGETVELLVEDEACDPRQAVTVANRLVRDGAVFVAGHACSGASIAASAVYEDEGIIQISPATTAPEFTDNAGEYILRICGRDDQQGVVAGNWIAEHRADATIAVLHDKSSYGLGLANVVVATLADHGMKPAVFEAVTAGEQDYSAVVTLLKQHDVDVLYFGGYHTEAGLILRQMRQAGLDTLLVAGDGLSNEQFWQITGDVGAGTLFTFGPDPRENPAAAAVVERFRDAGNEPEGFALYTYAAVQAWAQAAEDAGSFEPDAVAAALAAGSFETVLGSVDFDDNGDVTTPGFVLYEWRDGTYSMAEAQ